MADTTTHMPSKRRLKRARLQHPPPRTDDAVLMHEDMRQMLTDMVSVHFIDLGGDVTGNGVGAIVFTILSAFATFERERIAARIREVKQLKKAQGKFTGGRRAFGYDVIDGVKIPREDEQAVIREMIDMRAKGIGYREIAAWMAATQKRKMTFMGVRRTLEVAG